MASHRIRPSVWTLAVGLIAALVCSPAPAAAQYFGQNKVQYRTFDWKILQTEHFDVYYYQDEAEAAKLASRLAERWYTRLSRFFEHQLRDRQVLILYASPEQFRQTNAIEGLIGEGTGGVTEALKRRVVLPMSGSLADTDHVIGHELVHAFQYDITGSDSRDAESGGPGILQYPLWFVEGMAEYLSLGPDDSQTAMWMRDAAIREKLPNIKDLDKPEYFPYRWGQSLWAYIGAKYGDQTIASLVRSAANPSADLKGFAAQLGTDPATLSADWHKAILLAAEQIEAGRPLLESEPRRVIGTDQEAGRFNVGPRLSPDGTRIAFFSQRDRFSIDLYIADAKTGHIERRLTHSATDPHFGSLQFLNSAGAWSPDGRRLALTAVRGESAVLALLDPKNGHVIREVPLSGLDDAINPSFSPDGRSVVLSGNRGGFVDLFLLSLDSGTLRPLTNDPFADLEPTFTPDGRSIVFVTERFSTNLTTLQPGPLRLARLDLATDRVEPIGGFLHGKHISPQVSRDGRTLTFVADPDGVSNVYRMPIDGGPIEQITSALTGVAGITATSPALSAAADTGRLAFSVFEDGGNAIYILDPSAVVATVAPAATGAAPIVLTGAARPGDVQRMLADVRRGLPSPTAPAKTLSYTGRLSLDMISRPTITAGVSQFGSFVAAGMSALFSDMLGDHELGVGAQVAGDLADFGGELAYINRRHRWNWATVVNETPYRVDYLSAATDETSNTITLTDLIDRQTTRGVTAIAAFPFSTASRIELSASAQAYSFSRETKTFDYAADTSRLLDVTTTKASLGRSLYEAQTGAALVFDTSYFGATSPIYGQRYRLELDHSMGSLDYSTVLVDWRRYFMPKSPVTFAVRAIHYGRYGPDAEDSELAQLYAGYPELVHGYALGSISATDCQFVVGAFQCPVADSLVGSRMAVFNAEVRAPLVGLFRGDLKYGPFPIEVAAFTDAGVTWSRGSRPTFLGGDRHLLRSVGGAARFNVFGLLVLELAASRPLDRPGAGWQWQLGVREGF